MIPDNLDVYEQYEREQERVHRRLKRIAHEWERDDDLPWVVVPNDYGTHKECYLEGGSNEE
jgi:hypothetical protein